MKKRLAAAAAILLLLGVEACAHRLDEYLQATIICVEQNQLHASMRLVPGVAVSSRILEAIDTNHDGVLSQAEQSAYAEQVLRDLSITVNGKKTVPQLVSQKFPTAEEVKEGLGEIQIEFTVNLSGDLQDRKIVFENHHQNTISAYLVNCLVPRDPGIRILAQNRNETQSIYQLDIAQAAGSSVQRSDTAFLPWWLTLGRWSGGAGFRSLFRLGMRHIAEGTDHLLFLLALLLPAPLLVSGSRWAGFAGVRQSLLRILKIVTAFTVGHSITLALAALGAVIIPARPVEVLIAVSIFLSALHAMRPIFPGRETRIAGFFGLIHGLAFAATLGELGLGRWERVAGILAFNLGIETMQLIVVAATMPSLMLFSRTRAYPGLRICAALFAVFASMGWIADRLFGFHNSIEGAVNVIAHNSLWIAATLFLMALASWILCDVGLIPSISRDSP
jgi:hypothetical protein